MFRNLVDAMKETGMAKKKFIPKEKAKLALDNMAGAKEMQESNKKGRTRSEVRKAMYGKE